MDIRRSSSLKEACNLLRDSRPQLRELHVERIIIAYDGNGDSGCVENITAMKGNDQIELPDELRAAVNEAAYGLLPLGWENENGSVGELIINVRSRHIKREHNWRIEDTQYEEREILF
ncbi:MAG: hypothetical protein NXI22_04235 [bacterium]|nr:hypothetical protein [bacterium]